MSKRNVLKMLIVICSVLLGLAVVSPFEGAVHAASLSSRDCQLQALNAGDSEKLLYQVSGYGPGTMTMQQTTTVSNTVTGEVGFSIQAISAKVGASVTQSNAVTLSDSVVVPAGQFLALQAWAVFRSTLLENTCGGSAAVDVFDHVEYVPVWNQNI